MVTPKVLDAAAFAAILEPISADSPAGIDVRADDQLAAEFRAVRDARDAASKAEKDLWLFLRVDADDPSKPEKPKPPDWKKVIDLSADLLAKRSKDLWVAAWMIEGLARVHGFAGLHDGFAAARELCERYWNELYPRSETPEEEVPADEVLEKIVKLDLLDDVRPNVNLISKIDEIPITEAGEGGRRYTSADYKEALSLEDAKDLSAKARSLAAGAATLKDFRQAVEKTSPGFFEGLLADIEDSRREFDLLHEAIRERCGASRPPAADNIRQALAACGERVEEISGRRAAPAEQDSQAGDTAPSGSSAAPSTAAPGEIRTREDAFKALLKVADYFRRAEPHSPISYALEQAVRWGKMSLPELLKDLVSDERVLSDMFLRTGILPPEKSEEN